MKLIGEKIVIERDGLMEEASFGISDENMGLVLDMLRSKMYADPIQAICREISCNARDAHREIGTPDKPINIHLPSEIDPYYRVIDEGPGITPERIKNVFINFGSSTKRDTNTQTGGFGLGAKTPFAYCDAFQIITTTDIAGPRPVNSKPRMKRVYTAYIDESKRGILAQLEETETDLPAGTQICIPIRKENFSEFAKKTEKACQWWDVPPHVDGLQPFTRLNSNDLYMEGPGWKVYETKQVRNHSIYGMQGSSDPIILIDGISYPLSDDIRSHHGTKTPDEKTVSILFGGTKTVLLYFPNGQLTLSPNRETIHWGEDTKKIVKDRLLTIAKEIHKRLSQQVEKCANYIDACEEARKLRAMFTSSNDNEVLQLRWRGFKLNDTFAQPGHNKSMQWFGFELLKHISSKRGTEVEDLAGNTTGFFQIEEQHVARDRESSFKLSHTRMLVINDINLGTLSCKRAAEIFNRIPQKYDEFILVPDIHISKGSELETVLQHIEIFRLSSFMGKTASADDPPKERKVRKLIYRYQFGGSFAMSSIEEFEKDKQPKLWVMLDREPYDSRLCWSVRKNGLDLLGTLAREFKVTIYGAEKTLFDKSPSSFDEFTSVSKPVMEFIENTILTKFDQDRLKPFFHNAQSHSRPYATAFAKILPFLKCKADFAEYIRLDDEIQTNTTLARQCEFYLNVFDRSMRATTDGHGNSARTSPPSELVECDNLIKEIIKRYPLLKHITSDHHIEDTCRAYVEYVNMFDANRTPVTKTQSLGNHASGNHASGNQTRNQP